jgi:hypothetical protein
VLATVWRRIKSSAAAIWSWLSFLGKEHMPVWLSIILLGLTAWGTYELAPKINKRIQIDNNRSTYIGATITNFNTTSVELLKSTRRFNRALVVRDRGLEGTRGDVLDRITEMQWRLIDVGVVFEHSGEGRARVALLSSAIRRLGSAVNSAREPADQEAVLEASSAVGSTARGTVAALYDEADLRQP